jgi:hypothetical protein
MNFTVFDRTRDLNPGTVAGAHPSAAGPLCPRCPVLWPGPARQWPVPHDTVAGAHLSASHPPVLHRGAARCARRHWELVARTTGVGMRHPTAVAPPSFPPRDHRLDPPLLYSPPRPPLKVAAHRRWHPLSFMRPFLDAHLHVLYLC